jgi:FMN-dependent NADH-azoreductase
MLTTFVDLTTVVVVRCRRHTMLTHRMTIKGAFTMATLLKIDSSPMGERSISRKLTAECAKIWSEAHSGGRVISRDLTAIDIPVIDQGWVAAAYTPADARTAEQKEALRVSDLLIADLEKADEYVLGVPMHNFSIPSTLKLWIDQVVRAGKTFAYGSAGPKGFLTGKKATLLMASGGVYEHGTALAALNFVTPYLRTVFGFLGVTDVNFIAAEGTSTLMTGKVDPQVFLAPSLQKVHAQASL